MLRPLLDPLRRYRTTHSAPDLLSFTPRAVHDAYAVLNYSPLTDTFAVLYCSLSATCSTRCCASHCVLSIMRHLQLNVLSQCCTAWTVLGFTLGWLHLKTAPAIPPGAVQHSTGNLDLVLNAADPLSCSSERARGTTKT